MRKILITTNKKKIRFRNEDILAYALYEVLSRLNISRTACEISYFTGCATSTLFAIESCLSLTDTLTRANDFVNRYGIDLNMRHCDIRRVEKIVKELEWLGNVKPNCLVAIAFYTYCKHNSIPHSVKEICEKCDISLTNMYSLLRKIKKSHNDKMENILMKYFRVFKITDLVLSGKKILTCSIIFVNVPTAIACWEDFENNGQIAIECWEDFAQQEGL